MATGLRIGEACGLAWNAVDLDAGTVQVRAAAFHVRGQGLFVKTTKIDAGQRILVLPRWCTAMLRDRAERLDATADDRGGRPVFPSPRGGWRDTSNTAPAPASVWPCAVIRRTADVEYPAMGEVSAA
ncbi:hypothetical protein ACI8AK_05355 [Geodermatophilus sp. SYSU D00867]